MPAYTATAAKNTSRRAPYTVPARNESTGLIERIAVSAETKIKFKDVGKPRKVVKPKIVPLIKRITTPEERFELNRAFDQDLDRQQMAAEHRRLQSLQERLEKREADALRLSERLGLQLPEPEPVPTYSIPKQKFRKVSLTKRQRDYLVMVRATAERLAGLRIRVDEEGEILKNHPDYNVQRRYESVAKVMDWVDQLLNVFTTPGESDGFTHSDWRRLKRDLKLIGRINFDNVDHRWDFISESLAELVANGLFNYLF